MFPMRTPEALKIICQMAKEGDFEAKRYLRNYYSLKVYTSEEIEWINLQIAQGIPYQQAIKDQGGLE